MSLSKKQRIVLRAKFGGRCAYCGEVLKEKGWHADHVEPVLRKSVQDMQAAARGKFKLKATGEVFNESAKIFSQPVRPAICSKQHIHWKCSANK